MTSPTIDVAGFPVSPDHYINGQWVAAKSGATRDILNPSNNKVIAKATDSGAADAEDAISAAREAFDHGPWGKSTGPERADKLFALANLIEKHAAEFAKMATVLALAKYLGTLDTPVAKWRNLLTASAIILVPALIVLLQHDTGSAIVFLALKAGNLLTLSFDSGYKVAALFDNIGGLKPKAAVKSAGVVVGRVTAITFDNETFQAKVEIEMNKGVAFPKDTSAKILTAGLLGEQSGQNGGGGKRGAGLESPAAGEAPQPAASR